MTAGRLSVAFCLLLTGLTIYLLFRPYSLFSGALANFLPTFHLSQDWYWVSGSLPDGLWYAALLCLQKPLVFRKRVGTAEGITIVALLVPFMHEGLQKLGVVAGTFCMIDVMTYIIVLFIFLLKWNKKLKLVIN